MSATQQTYTADGSTQNFSVPMPYIARAHVLVLVDGVVKATPATYVWQSASTIRFNVAPVSGAAITIRRATPTDNRLVEFTDGAVLTEAQLNLSAKQNFFIAQELRDALDAIVGGTYTAPGSTIVEGAAQDVLGSAVAEEILSRITDIDSAGQLLLDNIMARRLLGEPSDDYTAFVLDTNTTLVSPTESLAQRFETLGAASGDAEALGAASGDAEALVTAEATARASADSALASTLSALTATVGTNTAAIATESTARASGDSANASSISTLSTTVSGHTTSITSLAAADSTFGAKYGVALNVDGFVSGFVLNSGGSSSSFDILTNKFRVVDPGPGAGATPVSVFTISGGSVYLQNLFVNGSLVVDNTITAAKLSVSQLDAVTANTGTLTVDEAIKIGSASAFMTGTGLWEGMDSGTPKWRVGNPSGDYIAFDGTNLTIAADVTLPGAFVSVDDAGAEIVRNDTDYTGGLPAGTPDWETVTEFQVFGTGTIAVRLNGHQNFSLVTPNGNGTVRILKNGSTVVGAGTLIGTSLSNTAADTVWTGIAVDAITDTFQVQVQGGNSIDAGSPPFPAVAYDAVTVNWVSVRASWELGSFF